MNQAKTRMSALLALLAPAVVLTGLAIAQQQDRASSQKDKTLLNDVGEFLGRQAPASDKWIGVLCRPVDDLLRAHVELPEGAGLVIEEVIPDSPAQKAGLKKHDILIEADGNPVTGLDVLIRGVSSAGKDGLELKWLRGGKTLSATVTPADRPEDANAIVVPQLGDNGDMGRLRAWLERIEKGEAGEAQPFQFRFFGPGITFRHLKEDFPADLSVQIQKSGQEPARITVRKGDSTWEITEENLNELPADIRPFVENMLKGGVTVEGIAPEELRGFGLPGFEKRFDEMNERMEKMLEELRQLRERGQTNDDDSIDA
jgi:hypothetical protein